MLIFLQNKKYHQHHHQSVLTARIPLFFLAICPYWSLILLSPLGGTHSPRTADEDKFT